MLDTNRDLFKEYHTVSLDYAYVSITEHGQKNKTIKGLIWLDDYIESNQ